MIPVSVVIITKNESALIDRCIQSIRSLTDDILVCDTGSTDETMLIASQSGARVIQLPWEGYGATKNAAHLHAKYDWIFSLDADEYIDDTLKNELGQLSWGEPDKAYSIRRKRFFKGKILQYGAWGNEKRIRIFPRMLAQWTEDLVHETLQLNHLKVIRLNGYLYDQTFKSDTQFAEKMGRYADLCAQKYHLKNIKGAGWKQVLSPVYTFIWNYIIRLGFMDGLAGWEHARMIAQYTQKKYAQLYRLQKKG